MPIKFDPLALDPDHRDHYEKQTVQHKLAEMKTEICVTRAFIDQCVALHDTKQLDASMACMAKIWYCG